MSDVKKFMGRTYGTSGETLISKPRDESLGYNMERAYGTVSIDGKSCQPYLL